MTTASYPRRIKALTYFTMMDEGVSGYLVAPGDVIDILANAYHKTIDTKGNSWLNLTPAEQVAQWGAQRFEVLIP